MRTGASCFGVPRDTPTLLRDTRLHSFVTRDNTVALSALVHGYVGKPDLAAITPV